MMVGIMHYLFHHLIFFSTRCSILRDLTYRLREAVVMVIVVLGLEDPGKSALFFE